MHNESEEPIAVAVVDAQAGLREGLVSYLRRQGRYRVAVQAARPLELLEALQGGAEVAVVIVEVPLALAGAEEPVQWLRAQRPALRVVAYCASQLPAVVLRTYRAGAQALLFKHQPLDDLATALDTVLRDAIYHTPYSQQVLLENPDGLTPEERRRQRLQAQLTPRQRQVLQALCRADEPTYARIAQELGVGRRTVEAHISELLQAFGVRSKTALVLAAVRVGLIEV